jgi:phospholipid/cholesterol/gamma-HCH transport system substrate-binding protein
MKITATAIKLGVFLAVTALTAVFLGLTLSETQVAGRPASYRAVFSNASYLTPSSDVRIAGIPVGAVDSVHVQPDSTVLVSFHVGADTPMPISVHAAIRYKNLIGDRYLELLDGAGDDGRQLPAGATIELGNTAPAVDLDALVGGFKPLFQALSPEQVNQLSSELISVFQGESGNVSTLLASVGSLTSTLADRNQVISSLIINLNDAMDTLDARDTELANLVNQLQQLVSGLAAERDPIGQSVTHLNELTGSAAGLLGDIRPDTAHLVSHLGQVSQTLNDHNAELLAALVGLGPTFQAISGIGVYGDFFDFYLCDVRVKVTGPGGRPVYSPWIESQVPRCSGIPTKDGQR